jgi:hypothetical protein
MSHFAWRGSLGLAWHAVMVRAVIDMRDLLVLYLDMAVTVRCARRIVVLHEAGRPNAAIIFSFNGFGESAKQAHAGSSCDVLHNGWQQV